MKKLYLLIFAILLGISFSFASGIVVRSTPIPRVPLTKITPLKANLGIIAKKVEAQRIRNETVIIKKVKNSNKTATLREYGGPIKSTFTPSSRVVTDTLFYWDPNAADYFYHSQPDSYDDNNYGVRFTPTHSGTLNSAGFYFYNLYGSGDVTVHVWDDNGGYPGTELGSVTINTSNINTTGSETVVDLSSLGISVNTSSDFYITYSLGSGIDTLGLIFDTVGTAPSRCYDYYPSNGWETSDWIHSNITWLINAYVDESSTSLPNLAPYQPTGWSSSLVCAVDSLHDTTATTSDTLNAGDTSYVSMAFANYGTGDVTDTCYFYLYVDGTYTKGWYVTSLQSNYYVPIKHAKILVSSAGSHTLSDTADATHRITESDETDNGTSENYYWKGSVTGKNLTPYTPSGWDAPVVVSSVTGTHTNGPNYFSDSTSYIDWAVKNTGTEDIINTFYVYLYIDGSPINGWQINGLKADSMASVIDYNYQFSEGSHTIGIFADSTNTVSETDENDNKYSHSFTFTAGGGTGYTGNAEYIIITDPSFVDAFQPLAWWKTKKGIPTKIVTTDSIYSNFTGYDNAEKIRNFIKAARDSGAMYILLGGQCDYENGQEYVARRNAYCMSAGAGYYNDEDTIITDLYFADLDGTWDGNGNHTYGETGDNVDMYPDVYVGRAPVRNVYQVQNFVNKILQYEKNPNTSSSYLKASFHPQGNLWNTNSGYSMPDTMTKFDPTSWSATIFRENDGQISRTAVRNEFNVGYNLVHFVGHGNESGVYYNNGTTTMLNNDDADNLSNGLDKLSIVTSIACFSGAMDEVSGGDCFAEHLVNATNGGAVASLLNSRYGWGYSSPEGALGPSGEQSKYFFKAIHQNNIYILGQAWAEMQSSMVPDAGSDTYFRWCLYERNLLGDPSMEIWTDVPSNFNVTVLPESIPTGSNDTISITVNDGSKAPVDNAVVTIANKSLTIYDTTHSTNGSASAVVSPNSSSDTIFITVTKHNYLPYETFITAYDGAGGIVERVNGIRSKSDRILSKKNGFKVELASSINGQINIEIIGLNGRVVRSVNKNATSNSLFVSNKNLPTGIYFIRLHNKTINKTFKVSVIR